MRDTSIDVITSRKTNGATNASSTVATPRRLPDRFLVRVLFILPISRLQSGGRFFEHDLIAATLTLQDHISQSIEVIFQVGEVVPLTEL